MISQRYQIKSIFQCKKVQKNPKAFDWLWDRMSGKKLFKIYRQSVTHTDRLSFLRSCFPLAIHLFNNA
jgi:hypothetical protein